MTTPFAETIGRLDPGRQADFVAINHRKALWPYQDGLIDIVDAIIQRAKTVAVAATVIGGVTVYENGVFTQIDRDQIMEEIAAVLAKPRTPAEEASIDTARRMQGFVTNFYEGYFDAARHTPFYKQSSRL